MTFQVMNVTATGAPETVVKAPAGEAADRPDLRFVLISTVGVIVSVWLAYLVWDNGSKKLFIPRSDYATLAGVVLLAAAIERFLEPLSYYLLPADKDKKAADEKIGGQDVEAPHRGHLHPPHRGPRRQGGEAPRLTLTRRSAVRHTGILLSVSREDCCPPHRTSC